MNDLKYSDALQSYAKSKGFSSPVELEASLSPTIDSNNDGKITGAEAVNFMTHLISPCDARTLAENIRNKKSVTGYAGGLNDLNVGKSQTGEVLERHITILKERGVTISEITYPTYSEILSAYDARAKGAQKGKDGQCEWLGM